MVCKEGATERGVRMVIGAALLLVYVLHIAEGAAGVAALVVGCVALATGIAGWCPASAALGINTCRKKAS